MKIFNFYVSDKNELLPLDKTIQADELRLRVVVTQEEHLSYRCQFIQTQYYIKQFAAPDDWDIEQAYNCASHELSLAKS